MSSDGATGTSSIAEWAGAQILARSSPGLGLGSVTYQLCDAGQLVIFSVPPLPLLNYREIIIPTSCSHCGDYIQ